jgi:predicted RNA-binding protein with PUA-like domain
MSDLDVLLERHHWRRTEDVGQHVCHGIFRLCFLRAIVPQRVAPVVRHHMVNFAPPGLLRTAEAMAYWLMKSEPDAYSIDELESDGREMWDGIRNYQARNMMRDDMRIGDRVFFYHSNCKEPGIVGIMKVASKPYPDPTQFDPESRYYDPKSSEDDPRWLLVDVEFVRKLSRTISLAELKEQAKLDGMILLRRGNRLSIMPVEKRHWDLILGLE